MEFAYEADASGRYRPIVGVLFCRDGQPLNPKGLPVKCLLDTGALNTMVRWEMADFFGIELSGAEDHEDIRVGGATRTGIKVVRLTLEVQGPHGDGVLTTPEMPVLFVKGELPTAGLLGASAFMSMVTVFREYEAKVNIRHAMDFCSDECPHSNGAHPRYHPL